MAMCEAWGITASAFKRRLDRRWDIAKALTMPVRDTDSKAPARTVPDHNGRLFRSVAEMCRAHGVPPSTFRKRIADGRPLEEALMPGRFPDRRSEHATDHLGISYRSCRAMCAAYGVSHQVFRRRMDDGMSLEQALTLKGHPLHKPSTGPDGRKYPNFKAMCDEYGINDSVAARRIALGMDLESALTTPTEHGTRITGPCGEAYPSVPQAAKAWHVCASSLRHHVELGETEPLKNTVSSTWFGTEAGRYKIMQCITWPWFLCIELPDDGVTLHNREALIHAYVLKSMKDSA